MRRVLALGAVIGLTAPALADPPPLFRPNKDVVVEYRIQDGAPGEAGTAGRTVTMYFTDQGNKTRFDAGAGRGYVITDTQAQRSIVVMTGQKMYVERPMDPGRSPILAMKDATITRKGNDTVVGLSCSVYDIVHDGDQGEACITDDGLVLRSRSGAAGGPHTMEAVKVTYAPQPASLFVPPADFQKADVPALRGGMTMPPAGAPPAR